MEMKGREMNLLIFSPTWIQGPDDPMPGMEAIHPKCRASIEAQRIEGRSTWVIGRDNPFAIPDHRNVLHQYQQARTMFLAGEWDALLTIEHDNVLPDDETIQRMLDTPGDVIYAPYMLRHGKPVLNTWQWINDRNLGMSLSNYPDELRRARESVVWKVSGAGFGCTLIQRRVLEVIEFTGPSDRDRNTCPDLRFAEACLRRHFSSNGRFDVPVVHYSRGHWLHPFQEYAMTKYVALETVNAVAAGRFMRLVKDHEIELSDEEAKDLSRVGYIEIAAADPAVEKPDETVDKVMWTPEKETWVRPNRRGWGA